MPTRPVSARLAAPLAPWLAVPRVNARTTAIAAALSLSLPAGAQTAASAADAAVPLPPVAVTAKGYAAQDVDTPVAQTVLMREDLLRKQAANLGEALRGEPGLAWSRQLRHGQAPDPAPGAAQPGQ